ncbi:hypothetical protein HPP92_006857 [Vanilla planifolia]|uniref:Uncharacterized protein n=1 Tax=Vanilla planifolia TaxID=51239 RepID=A0A835RF65_VANPL|nr:hypothetical protein HPP92_007092 [Vanilla planifolia]KAG0489994.1 hypothetical protein HPP92_006857 [Vanilla planifolia]
MEQKGLKNIYWLMRYIEACSHVPLKARLAPHKAANSTPPMLKTVKRELFSDFCRWPLRLGCVTITGLYSGRAPPLQAGLALCGELAQPQASTLAT